MNDKKEQFTIDNGIVLHNIRNMDGGGSTYYRDFLEIIKLKEKLEQLPISISLQQ